MSVLDAANLRKVRALLSVLSFDSDCDRLHVACVLEDDSDNIVGFGYNHSLSTETCVSDGHIMEDGHCVRAVHAEMDALSSYIKGTVGDNHDIGSPSSAFVTNHPCLSCIKVLVDAGITSIYWFEDDLHKYSQEVLNSIVPPSVSLHPLNRSDY